MKKNLSAAVMTIMMFGIANLAFAQNQKSEEHRRPHLGIVRTNIHRVFQVVLALVLLQRNCYRSISRW